MALRDMRQILKKQEDHEEALNFIASFYSEQKINLTAAEKMARKALSLKPHSSYFLNTLGWILFQKGKVKSALHYLKKAFSKNNTDSHIAKRLGKVYLKLKILRKAIISLKKPQNWKRMINCLKLPLKMLPSSGLLRISLSLFFIISCSSLPKKASLQSKNLIFKIQWEHSDFLKREHPFFLVFGICSRGQFVKDGSSAAFCRCHRKPDFK